MRFSLAVVLVVVALAYAVALDGPFQFDDYATVATDPSTQEPAAWREGLGAHVRPLLKASFVATHAVGAPVDALPLVHRVGNIVIHLGVVTALYLLGRRVMATCVPIVGQRCADRAACAAAAIVGLHPLCTEAVSYIIGRSVCLSTLFAVLSMLLYIRARTVPEANGVAWMAAAMVAYGAAALTRETSALSLPLVYVLWEWARRDTEEPAFSARRFAAASRSAALPLVITTLVAAWMLAHDRYGFLLDVSQRIAFERLGEPSLIPAIEYFLEGFVLLRYPNIDPDIDPHALSALARVGWLTALGIISFGAWRVRVRRPYVFFGFAWTLSWLVPLYAVQVRHDAVSERHFYPAIWGLAFLLSVALEVFAGSGRVRQVLASLTTACVGAVLLIVTVTRNADYRSEVSLWEATSRGSPEKLRVLNNLGVAYMEAGRWDDAQSVFRRAIDIDPGYERARRNLDRAERRRLDDIPGAQMPQ